MSSIAAPPSPILWQSGDASVTLIDIPRSIASAQQPASTRTGFPYDLLSTSPLSAPFATNEPKSASAKAKLADNSGEQELHRVVYHPILRQALHDVRESFAGAWCLPRPFVEDAQPPPAKRRRIAGDEGDGDETAASGTTTLLSKDYSNGEETCDRLPDELLPYLARGNESGTSAPYYVALPPPRQNRPPRPAELHQASHFYSNPHDQSAIMTVTPISRSAQSSTFNIPPRSTFYIGDCAQDSLAFRSALYNLRSARPRERAEAQANEKDSRDPTTFDFILLDPPWPNRSVKRTHATPASRLKPKTYTVAPCLSDIRDMLQDMHLDFYMASFPSAPGCLVGIWITNSPAIRHLVLNPDDGLFACWGLELVEEWIWLKITASGEPVTPIDAVWRKPYEVLLLGRRRAVRGPRSSAQEGSEARRRVILAVPDLHSRKPCLREMIEPLVSSSLPEEDEQVRESGEGGHPRVLEVFARHLVAGWTSFGDECIKFNWRGYWRKKDDDRTKK